MRKLYLKTTTDEYELPEAVAESPGELARMIGTTKEVVLSSISHRHRGWIRMEVEEDET